MSQTFSLVCPSTKLSIWIGQGSFTDGMRVLYTGQPETMERLKRFLNAHKGKPLVFACDDQGEYLDCEEFEQPDWDREDSSS